MTHFNHGKAVGTQLSRARVMEQKTPVTWATNSDSVFAPWLFSTIGGVQSDVSIHHCQPIYCRKASTWHKSYLGHFSAFHNGPTSGDVLSLVVPFLFNHLPRFPALPFPSAWPRQVVSRVWLQPGTLTTCRLFHSVIWRGIFFSARDRGPACPASRA